MPNKIHMGPAKCALDLGDGSERGEYVNQDYILNVLGRHFSQRQIRMGLVKVRDDFVHVRLQKTFPLHSKLLAPRTTTCLLLTTSCGMKSCPWQRKRSLILRLL